MWGISFIFFFSWEQKHFSKITSFLEKWGPLPPLTNPPTRLSKSNSTKTNGGFPGGGNRPNAHASSGRESLDLCSSHSSAVTDPWSEASRPPRHYSPPLKKDTGGLKGCFILSRHNCVNTTGIPLPERFLNNTCQSYFNCHRTRQSKYNMQFMIINQVPPVTTSREVGK